MTIRRSRLALFWLAFLLAGLVLACSDEQGTSPAGTIAIQADAAAGPCPCLLPQAMPGDGLVGTRAIEGLGIVLVSRDGMTLYTYANDAADSSACSQACAERWPPLLTTGTVGAPASDDLTMVLREDGAIQLAFRGKPLYRFAGDRQAGDALGHGVDSLWSVAQAERLPRAN